MHPGETPSSFVMEGIIKQLIEYFYTNSQIEPVNAKCQVKVYLQAGPDAQPRWGHQWKLQMQFNWLRLEQNLESI